MSFQQLHGKIIGYNKIKGLDGEIRLEPIYQNKRWSSLTIASTLNTPVQCRLCMGSGKVVLGNIGSLMHENVCGHCHGSKIMKSI